MRILTQIIILLGNVYFLQAVQLTDDNCSEDKPCEQGCCNTNGNCGFGPDFCGPDACVSTCNAEPECGEYASKGKEHCPLNVCCSEFGFCGTSEPFCGEGCQSGCKPIHRPACKGSSAGQRYVGYYESWVYEHPCDNIHPSDINVKPWTHLMYAFSQIKPDTYGLQTMNYYDKDFYRAFTDLKAKKPSLECYLSVGGWDAGGKVFSKMANSTGTRKSFIISVIGIVELFGFDGIDIDWEYPVADDRGGSPEDFENYVQLLKELREALSQKRGLTIAIPASYWYLRGFNIQELAKHVDWFNFMSYDIHGTWDGHNEWTHEVVNPHTNLTEISSGLDLLWRNKIPPEKVSLGLAFYGRSFTLEDSSCTTPGCPFRRTHGRDSGGARKGDCTGVSGTLSNYEINRTLERNSPKLSYDETAAVNWMTWDEDQWVSFDNAKTLKQKFEFANSLCLGGTFAWALDLGGPGTLNSLFELDDGMGLGGADPDGADSGSGDIYIAPEIYENKDPVATCVPPCNLILPPISLQSDTTITFAPYTTSLEVAWPTTSVVTLEDGSVSTSAALGRTIQTTTLTIPPVTTSMINVWNWEIPEDHDSDNHTVVMPSILPPPFIITDNPPRDLTGNPTQTPGTELPPEETDTDEPSSSDGIIIPGGTDPSGTTNPPNPSSPVVTRTITPPPFPHTSNTDHSDITLPSVSFTVGPPGPLCTANCGPPCKIFCDGPCLLDCGNRDDFLSPLEDSGGGNDKPKNKKKCRGTHCKNGKCVGPLCVSYDCTGPDCHGGICLGKDCSITMCGGENCSSGPCVGDCGFDDRCIGPNCIGYGCAGPDCHGGKCEGFNCTPVVCEGTGCKAGYCEGPECEERGDCEEPEEAEHCTETVTEIKTDLKATAYSTTTRTDCATVTACSAEASTITTTKTIDEDHIVTITEHYEFAPTHDVDWYQPNVDKLLSLRKSRDAARFSDKTTTTTSERPSPSPTGATGDDDFHCFKQSFTSAERGILIDYVTRFCEAHEGETLDASDPDGESIAEHTFREDCLDGFGCRYATDISVQVLNDCVFTFGGHSASSVCGSSLRIPIDYCNTDGVKYKFGGNVTTDCAVWTVGPITDHA